MKIVVIEALGLHLGYLGCYGNDWVATPNLDRLAGDGIVFDWHFADQPELRPITPWHERSVGTGRYAFPAACGVAGAASLATPQAANGSPRVARCLALTSFAADASKLLADNDDWLWIEGPSLLPPWDMDDVLLDVYFDEDDVEEGLTPWTDPPLDLVNLNEAEVLQLQNTYAAVVTLFDAQLGALLERIDHDTLVCVTARSGLPLGEHGMIGTPRARLHDELVHVPLVMRLPTVGTGGSPVPEAMETASRLLPRAAGLRVSALTQGVDLLPTFLEASGREPDATLHGRSLCPLVRGEISEVRPYAASALRVDGDECWLLRTRDWALHLPVAVSEQAPKLYVKPDDRWEVNDLYQQQIEAAEPLVKALQAFADAIRTAGE